MSNLNVNQLARLLAERTEKQGLRSVAKEIGVSPATLSRVQRGYLPDLETFRKICGWLKIDPGEILGLNPKPKDEMPKVAVHFKKDAAVTPKTAQALAQMVLAAHRAWLFSESNS